VKTFWDTVIACVTVLLAFAGFGGLAYRTFREDGWMANFAAGGTAYGFDHPYLAALAAFALLGAALVARRTRCERAPPFLLYLAMATGAYFIIRFALHGAP
jgi:hypothetical protein